MMAAEKMTTIRLPSGLSAGFMDYGEQDAATMIATYRSMAERDKAAAEEILAASDADFRIEVVRGKLVERPVRLIQEGRAHTPDCRCVRCCRARAA